MIDAYEAVTVRELALLIVGGVRVLVERLMRWWSAGGADVSKVSEDQLLKELVEIWSGMDGSRIALIPGAFEGVAKLKQKGIAVWLVTNKEEPLARAFLAERGLGDAFDGVIGGGGAARPKPWPDMIERAMKEAGVAPAECAMVGDSRNDALAARAAGVRALLVESGYNEGIPLGKSGRIYGNFPGYRPGMRPASEGARSMLKALLGFALLIPFAVSAAPQKEPPTADAVAQCYSAIQGDNQEARGKCLAMELEMVQATYKDVTDRVASYAKALDKPSGTRTRWNKFSLSGQSFETFVKRECDFVGITTKGNKRVEANAELACRIGYYRLRTSILTNRHLSQSSY